MVLERKKSSEPLYLQLKGILKNEILEGKYKPGDLIGTEMEYAEAYNISRVTVRRAINELVQEGYLKSKRGYGTIVLPPKIKEPLIRIKSFSDEMKERGIQPSTKWADIVITKAFSDVADNLNLNEGDEVYRINRLRCGNGEPLVLFETYLRRELNLPLDNSIYYDSLYDYLREAKNISIKKLHQQICAINADKTLSEILEIEPRDAVLAITRISYDKNNNVVEYTKGYYIANRYEYYIKLEER